MLYSYQSNKPQELPQRIKFPDGRTHYLAEGELSKEQLSFAGWEGPIEIPPFILGSEKLVWDSEISVYKVESLTESEKQELWAPRKEENTLKILELKEIATERKIQLAELGASTGAVENFLNLLSSAEFESINPFELRLPSTTLLGVVPYTVEYQNPFDEWLKEHYESDLSHGYIVRANELNVNDPILFAAHKQAKINEFLTDYLEAQFSAIAYISQFRDNLNGTGELTISSMGVFDAVSVVIDDQEGLEPEGGKVLLKGSGLHTIKVMPTITSAPCGKVEIAQITII